MDILQKAKEIIKENYKDARHGIFDCCNTVGDSMITLYAEDGLIIDICYDWEYFEVFGLSDSEFEELEKYYKEIRK